MIDSCDDITHVDLDAQMAPLPPRDPIPHRQWPGRFTYAVLVQLALLALLVLRGCR